MINTNEGINVASFFDGISCGQVALNLEGFKIKNYYASEIDKDAMKVTQSNFPNTIQLGDITKLNPNQFNDIDLILCGSPCFTKGNFVMTNNGYKPIEDINVGDYVLTHNNRYCKVLKIGNEFKETVKLKTQGSILITTTEKHPFYCYDNNNFYWKNISEFKKKDKVVSLKINEEIDLPNFSDIDLYILGRFLADGCCYKTKRLNRKNSFVYKFKISIGKHKIEDFKNKVDNRFSYIEERTAINAFIYRKEWVELGEKFGHLAHNKFVPNFILNLPKERLKIFIDGYLDGDGHNFNNKNYRFSSVSEKLILTMSLAIQKCFQGVSINFTKKEKLKNIEGRIVNQRNYNTVTFDKIYNENKKFLIKENFLCYNIKKYEKTNIIEKVYNIEVEHDNSYIVNNLIVHNCQSFSRVGDGSGFDGKSGLFWNFIDLFKEIKHKYFLFENVVMKKEWEDIITESLGVSPIKINSSLLTAQNRPRLYWTNIPNVTQPKDKGLVIKDVINCEFSDNYPNYLNLEFCGKVRKDLVKNYKTKASCLTATMYKGQISSFVKNDEGLIYKLTPNDCEILQSLPLDYTKILSNTQRYKSIGNGWTVDVIRHILKNLKNE